MKGHDGEEGNEAADQAAKYAIVEGEKLENHRLDRNIIKTRLMDRNKAEWLDRWEKESTGRLTYEVFKTVEPKGKYSHIHPEYDRKLLNRAASGHFPVNSYLKRIKKRENDLCIHCKTRETIEHLIVYCNRFEELRVKHLGIDKVNELKHYLTKYTETTVKILKTRLEEKEEGE